jgi:[calcium/calmodulin-dependent protein kinase] kinase
VIPLYSTSLDLLSVLSYHIMSSQGSSSRRPLHLQPPTGINILPPSPIDPSHSSPFRSPSPSTQRPPFAADALSASPSDDAGLLLPTRIEDTGVPLARVPSPSSPDYRPRPKHHRRTSSSHQVRETVDGSQSMTEDGRLVNQYRIGKSLGQGAYAKVELGVDVTTGKEYVSCTSLV